jgi:hypothetical protein
MACHHEARESPVAGFGESDNIAGRSALPRQQYTTNDWFIGLILLWFSSLSM